MSEALEEVPKLNILLAATGSVATVKVPVLVDEILSKGHRVKVVLSETACHFVSRDQIVEDFDRKRSDGLLSAETCRSFDPRAHVYLEEDEWKTWTKMGDPVLHIALGKWADVLIIAPLSANTMAKFANGLCDNLITSVVRAWDYSKPIVCAPAMNTRMWLHPVTRQHIDVLKQRDRMIFVDPVVKTLACKDVGVGAMAPPKDIVQKALASLM